MFNLGQFIDWSLLIGTVVGDVVSYDEGEVRCAGG